MLLVPFEDSDCELLASWIITAEFNMLWGGPRYQWPLTREQILQHHSDLAVHPFMVTADRQKIGFIELYQRAEQEVRLCRVLIAQHSARGQGLGRLLIRQAVEHARCRLGARFVSLAVFERNEAAFNCYRAEGFQIVRRDTDARQFAGDVWPLIYMAKQLEA